MKILFVRPESSRETIGLQHLMLVEPLELEVLYGLMRPNDEGQIIDLLIEAKPFRYFLERLNPDLICFTGYITNVATILGYCAETKKFNPGITTVVGGVHCEVCPEDFESENVDFRVVRNATRVFPVLLEAIENKAIAPKGVLWKGEKLALEKLPAIDYFFPPANRQSVAKYRSKYYYIFHPDVALVKTSFGCPFTCNFCFCRVITSGGYHQRSVDDVIDELKTLPQKEIYIVDDDFLVNKNWLQEFCEKLEQQQINKIFLVYGRADFIANNPELIARLRGIGMQTVIVGFESFSDDDLKAYDKKTSVLLYQKTMEVLLNEKIDCYATIIIPPHWDKNDFKKMVKEVKALGIHYVNLQPLTPLPKTETNFAPEKIIIPRTEYDKWDLAHVTVKPEKLTVAEFYSEILKAYYSIIYRPKVLLGYLIKYKPAMLLKMLRGGLLVGKQYKRKIREAKRYA